MLGFGVTSFGSREQVLPAAWRETFVAVAIPLVALGAFAFALIVLPWIISI